MSPVAALQKNIPKKTTKNARTFAMLCLEGDLAIGRLGDGDHPTGRFGDLGDLAIGRLGDSLAAQANITIKCKKKYMCAPAMFFFVFFCNSLALYSLLTHTPIDVSLARANTNKYKNKGVLTNGFCILPLELQIITNNYKSLKQLQIITKKYK